MYVKEFFSLNEDISIRLQKMKPKFGYDGFGELVFYRTYSRLKIDGGQENWADVVIRVINGMMTIRKDWYIRNYIEWDEAYWQKYAAKMADAMFRMYWLPPGRGLWAMGTPFIYERGAMALNNCGFTKLGGNDSFSNDIHWMMDALMLGVGVGFEPIRDELELFDPIGTYIYEIADSREGWIDSVRLLIDAYTQPRTRKPVFIYERIRREGLPIRGFGGKASGPAPLKRLHEQLEFLLKQKQIDRVRLKTDVANLVGVCVVAGNVRRSAELAKGRIHDLTFLDLKDYDKYPEREAHGWMSNNTVALYDDHDFEMLEEVAKRVVTRGEPGIMNLRNFKYGRIGKPIPVREDEADGLNPCGEIPLEDKELCNVVETCPTRCPTVAIWYDACEYSSFYASSVSLLPTHRTETNRVVARNRRIGVGIIDWTGWVHEAGLHKVTAYMRRGYDRVSETNKKANSEAGVPEAIRKTTIKPGGTVPKLVGKTPGAGYPTFDYTLRRIRIAVNHPMRPLLDNAGVPSEPEFFDPAGTLVYEVPILQGPVPPADKISIWEQAVNIATLQREWADNSVSNTIYFKPKWTLMLDLQAEEEFVKRCSNEFGVFIPPEFTVDNENYKLSIVDKYGYRTYKLYKFDPHHEEDQIIKVAAAFAPLIKAMSFLPHSAKGVYRQMPEEGITKEEHEIRLKAIKRINWSNFRGSDGEDEKFCQGDICEVKLPNGSAN